MTATFATALGRQKLVLPGIGRTATIRVLSMGGSVVKLSGLQNRYSQKSAALQRDRCESRQMLAASATRGISR